jgi:hypothetical protein
MILPFLFAIAQVTAPVLPDNQWRPSDVSYPWPLPQPEWDVLYSHGDLVLNGEPPAGVTFQWECFLDERRKTATCFSTWDVKAGSTCRGDRNYLPWEHPAFFYERYRGINPTSSPTTAPSSRVYLWTYNQRLTAWPEWNTAPVYSWTYQRLQWIPSGEGCSPLGGCSPRARYYIREGGGGASVPDSLYQLNTSPVSPLDGTHKCRGWLNNTNWCAFNLNRPECN